MYTVGSEVLPLWQHEANVCSGELTSSKHPRRASFRGEPGVEKTTHCQLVPTAVVAEHFIYRVDKGEMAHMSRN